MRMRLTGALLGVFLLRSCGLDLSGVFILLISKVSRDVNVTLVVRGIRNIWVRYQGGWIYDGHYGFYGL